MPNTILQRIIPISPTEMKVGMCVCTPPPKKSTKLPTTLTAYIGKQHRCIYVCVSPRKQSWAGKIPFREQKNVWSHRNPPCKIYSLRSIRVAACLVCCKSTHYVDGSCQLIDVGVKSDSVSYPRFPLDVAVSVSANMTLYVSAVRPSSSSPSSYLVSR